MSWFRPRCFQSCSPLNSLFCPMFVVDYCMLIVRSSVSVCTCPCHLLCFIKWFKEVPRLLVPCSWLLRATSNDWIRDRIIHQLRWLQLRTRCVGCGRAVRGWRDMWGVSWALYRVSWHVAASGCVFPTGVGWWSYTLRSSSRWFSIDRAH